MPAERTGMQYVRAAAEQDDWEVEDDVVVSPPTRSAMIKTLGLIDVAQKLLLPMKYNV